MSPTRIGEYRTRIRAELRRALSEDHAPRETAGSFAVGTFVTMLPTLGTGLIVFFAITYLFDSVSKIALFASILVFNPLVKWGVYAASFALGVLLLGPVEGVTTADVSLQAGPPIVVRLVVGNVVLAVIATAVSYLVVHRLAVRYETAAIADALETVVEETLEADTAH